ncbi:MAG: LD-carboxypeptidase [Bacteroidia bacterium]|nr:LD-carboxypeptidase [Bacteroidia bacterium]MDW8014765.1 LD-carboxypeptidase [Bacteroidia bacterium]
MRWPPPLQPGDKVALIAPSRSLSYSDIQGFFQFARRQGWRVEYDEGLFAKEGILAGSDEHRLKRLQAALEAPDLRAIWFVRGGYGVSRLWRFLRWEGFQRYPKWLIGFSDITPLLWGAAQAGIVALHAPVAVHVPQRLTLSALDHLLSLLQKERFDCVLSWKRQSWHGWRVGTAFGPLLGGNLSLLETLCGTPLDIKNWDSAPILFWEEVGEYYYRLDRMSWHLRNADWYKQAAALLVGGLTALHDDEDNPFGFSLKALVEQSCEPYLPLAMGLPVSHDSDHYALPIGAWSHLQIHSEEARLRFWRD